MADDQSQAPDAQSGQTQSEKSQSQADQLTDASTDGSEELALPNPIVLAGIGLVLLAIVTFLPTLRGEGLWLDDVSLTDNPFVRAADGVARFWTSADRAGRYQPLTLTSYWLEYRFFHADLAPAHFVNIVLHALVVLLLWMLLRKLDVPGAWAAAAIFAVHPVHAQAVAWISGRSVVLAAAFYLASLLVYLRFVGITQAEGEKTLFTLPPEPERLWGLAFVLFLCALLSNAGVAVTLPIAVMVMLWWKRDAITGAELLGLLPFFVVGVGIAVWTAWLQVISLASLAMNAALGFTPTQLIPLIAARGLWFYALKIVAPYPLMFDYPRWAPAGLIGVLAAIALLSVLAALWFVRERIGRGALAAALLFVLVLTPLIGLLDPPAIRYAYVADYRQYLASAAVIAALVAGVAMLLQSPRLKNVLDPSYVAGTLIVLLALLTFRQGTFYRNSLGLWNHTVTHNPRSLLAADGYGDAMIEARQYLVADRWYEKAQSIAPNDPRAATGLGTATAALAYEDQSSGQPDAAATQQTAAEQYFRDALRMDPDYKDAYVALAEVLIELKHDDLGAIDPLKHAIQLDPSDLHSRLRLGGAQRRAGLLKDAETTLTELLEDAPDEAAVHTELGNVYIQEQNLAGALSQWEAAVKLDPASITVRLNFGALLDSSGQSDLAAKQFKAATLINPSSALAHYDLGHVYSKLGHRHDAVVELSRAVELDPHNARAQDALAKALVEEQRLGAGTPATSQPTDGQSATSQPSGTDAAPLAP